MKKGTLTLKKMEEIYDNVRLTPLFPNCFCGRKSKFVYFFAGDLLAGACGYHAIKKKKVAMEVLG